MESRTGSCSSRSSPRRASERSTRRPSGKNTARSSWLCRCGRTFSKLPGKRSRYPPPSTTCSPVRGIVQEATVSDVLLTRFDRFPTRRSGVMAATSERDQLTRAKPKSRSAAVARLFVLELSGGRIHSMSPDGSERKVIVDGCHLPDGIAVDTASGHIYWTNMGTSPGVNDGSIERADLDGRNRKMIVPPGLTFTPKQIQLDKKNGKLYWGDREGMRVMRCNLDGSLIETLVETGRGEVDRRDQTRWCVGITIDPKRGQIYWTQKGPDNGELGRIFRAGIDLPWGESPDERTDIEVFYDRLPEPIDLELDLENRVLYWTDRGDPPRGNTVNRASIEVKPQAPEIVLTHLMEGIGIALDVAGDRMFVTDLGGSVYAGRLDGSEQRNILFAQGNLSGVAYAKI